MEKERKTSKFPTIKKMKEPEKSESPPKKVAKLSIKEVPNTETTNTIPSNEIDESVCDEFIQHLTISKFKEFADICKQKEIENIKHDMLLKKSQFMQIMKMTFPNNNESLIKLYEQIFNRFKIIKAEITPNHKSENYFISKIYSEDEIDIFEICCALICFIKCYVCEKLHLLFELADIDDDGFINENEVRKLIYTINLIFYEEESPSGTNSTIMSQSLASIKAKKAYNMIMKHPGNLSTIIQEEKCINFKQFLYAVKKVYNYKFDLMPLFVSLKKALYTVRDEKELEININIFDEYAKISNDIVSEVKKEGDIGNNIFDFRKNLDIQKKHLRELRSVRTRDSNKKAKSMAKNRVKNYKGRS